MKIIIKNGRVIDPANSIDDIADLFISGGVIEKLGKGLKDKADVTIDADKRIVAPGFVDIHAHLREPGREDKETVRTGTRSAVRGGFTSVCCMPNTEPPLDDPGIIKALKEIISKDALANVFIVGAITGGRLGKVLTDIKSLKKEGIVAISDDGACVGDEGVLAHALKEAKSAGLPVIEHCEDTKLSAGGVMNKGFASTKMGLRGIPREAELTAIARDIKIARETAGHVHIAHVSCKESVELIRKAKRSGVKVTAETAPHYFSLTEECSVTYDTNTKMNPPLRTGEDVEAIKRGLADGTIDAIATDHAPHTDSEKDVEFDLAPFGIIGFETCLSLAVMELVDKKVLSWNELIMKLSSGPACIIGLRKGALGKGQDADIVIIDPDKEYIYKRELIESKSRNSPFIDWRLKAKVTDVIVGGNIVMKDERIAP